MDLYLVKLHVGKTNPNACGADSCIVAAQTANDALDRARKLARQPNSHFPNSHFTAYLLARGGFADCWGHPEGVLFGISRFVNERFPDEMFAIIGDRRRVESLANADNEKRLRAWIQSCPGKFSSTLSRQELIRQMELDAQVGSWPDFEAALRRCGYLIDHDPHRGWACRLPHPPS